MKNKDKNEVLELIKSGLDYKEIAEKTGVSIPTLRMWKSRYVNPKENTVTEKPKKSVAKSKPLQSTAKKTNVSQHLKASQNDTAQLERDNATLKAAYQSIVTQHDTALSEVLALQKDLEKVQQSEREHMQLKAAYESLTAQYEATQSEVLALQMESPTNENWPLILAVVALRLSAVYGVGEILSEVFHSYVMGYLTAAVFVSAGLIMFASNKFVVGVSWVVLVATFLLESYCNYLTIYMKMEVEKLASFQQYTNTDLLFLCIAVFVPLVTLALEYLLFRQPKE